MSDAERYDLLDDDRLAWRLPGVVGLEVAQRWRQLNDKVDRLERRCDRLEMARKYAALLIHQGHTTHAQRLLLSDDALEPGRIAAEIADKELSQGDR